MMFGEMLVGNYAVEENMSIFEGETATHAQDIRTTEIAIWDDSEEENSVGTMIPRERFVAKRPVSTDFLPFDLRVDAYFKNHELSDRQPDQETLANAGFGKDLYVSQERAGAGADSDSAVDVAACYVTLLRKGTKDELGTYMLTQRLDRPEEFEFEEKKYRLFLRFRHNPKPYAITLIDVARKNYVGTNTPQDYHSDIRLTDSKHPGEGIKKRIWMNNPLRYAGETFYQSKYDIRGGREITVLQIVKNRGWMIPYVSCMLVIIGMLAHFAVTLARFLNRRSAADEQLAIATAVNVGAAAIGVISTSKQNKKPVRGRKNVEVQKGNQARYIPIAILAVAALMTIAGAYKASKGTNKDEFDLKGFGSLPVAYQGRVKPFDTFARNTLRAISNSDEFVIGKDDKQPAIRFLLDLACQRPEAFDYQVFRIPSLQVQDKLGLTARKRFRYSYSEIANGIKQLKDEFEAIRKKKADELTQTERKLVQLFRRMERFHKVRDMFLPPPLSPLGDPNSREAAERFKEEWRDVLRFIGQIEQAELPRPVPGELDTEANLLTENEIFKKTWQIYGTALSKAYCDRLFNKEGNPAMHLLETMRVAYGSHDVKRPAKYVRQFNKAVDDYHKLLKAHPPTDSKGVTYESFYNSFNPFYLALQLYVVAFVLAALSWLYAPALWNRAAFCLLVFTFALHTYALLGRIYISGRPPVTNLYSSSVFIGWGCVLLALILELLYRLGIGNFVASVAGFGTLLVSIYLGADGDTFAVLQAVLDTQFWLSTHVVTVTFGYSTTFVAGLLGIQYIAMGVFSTNQTAEKSKSIARMIYGVICFAMFFSFFGTVLGGLWADDSWGRFWGWDPKENGALIIVLWNALILHARWGGMIRDRGLAVLAVAGNIVTCWSWFGVNELGVGLHSYGFTDGVLLTLGIFAGSQLLIIAVGCMPKKYWKSLA